MSDNQKPSIKSIILYGIAIIVVAFVGVLAGNWFVSWRQERQWAEQEAYAEANRSLLRINEPFPTEQLYDLDGNAISTEQLIAGKPLLILFIAPGCEPCKNALDVWTPEIAGISDRATVIGIAAGDVDDVAAYKAKLGLQFPIYCDVDYLFPQQYDIINFPSIVGVTSDGLVGFVKHGYRGDFSLDDAYDLFSQSE
ncbi:MAG: redoxin domain-containing protein [Candidatus Zixiibacteriota bacterium]